MARMMGVMSIKVTPDTKWSTPPSQRLFLCLESEKGTETEFTDQCKMFKTMGPLIQLSTKELNCFR